MKKPYYSKKVIEHFLYPKNFGKMKNADGVGKVGNVRCGDIMNVFIKIDKKNKKEIIKDIKFHTLGCAAAIATSDIISELVKGKTLKESLKIGYKDIVNELGYLPPIKIHCANLAEQGLKKAIQDYVKKSKKKNKDS